MKITIHRGKDRIGGCITEIQSDSGTRIFIDLGHLLPEGGTPVKDIYDIPDELDKLLDGVSAVFYTHYHGDHIGFKAGVYRKGIDQYLGPTARTVLMKLYAHMKNAPKLKAQAAANLEALLNFKVYKAQIPVEVGDIKLTPFFVSHSAADAYMFLIECDGKKVLHTGDFREHGYLGKGLMPTINKLIKWRHIDVLITEGTMLSRDNAKVLTESELQQQARDLMKEYDNLFVLCSSTDQDRLASFYQATKKTDVRKFVVDGYQLKQLKLFSKTSGHFSPLYRFNDVHNYDREKTSLLPEMAAKGFTMLIRNNDSFKKRLAEIIPQINLNKTALVYSQFSGYLDKNFKAYNKELDEFVHLYDWDIKPLHTSGHATKETLAKVCNAVNPKLAIIPIHKEAKADFKSLDISEELKSKVVENKTDIDGESFSLTKDHLR